MTVFTIDKEKCHKDGLCAAVCPRGIIHIEINESFPTPTEDAEELCISCGHCSAVCPHKALQLNNASSVEPESFDRNKMPTGEQLHQLIRGRRSIRAYKKKSVSREVIAEIISLARHAPTARNSQLLQWLVIGDPEKLHSLKNHVRDWMQNALDNEDPGAIAYGFDTVLQAFTDGVDPILRDAPGLVVLLAPAAYPMGLIDSTIATATFELIAASREVGTCWAGYFMMAAKAWAPLSQELMLPDGYHLTTAIMVGHPKYNYTTLPERNAPVITWR
jgi:nitroreductase/NAD-dependent dihydropyrimidine dehydrogenase PreA subunit